MARALIVYGTRYGAAAGASEEIARTLRAEGMEARVVNAKEEDIRDIAGYDLIIVGSGIQIDRWTGEPEKFLKRFRKELAGKRVALIVCCGSASQLQGAQGEGGRPDAAERARRKYLEEKAAEYGLQGAALGLFGGVYDFGRVPWWAKKAMEAERPRLAAAYKETRPGVYDTRDWDTIQSWAKALVKEVCP